MNESTLLVSVVTVTYGHENYILETIKGVLNQKFNGQIEFIIANDHSPDRTDEIIKDYLSKCKVYNNITINYTLHEVNKGMTENFKWAFSQAKGKYIALCEGDDYWSDPLKLQKQVDFMEADIDCSLSCHDVSDLLLDGEIIRRNVINENRYLSNEEIIIARGKKTSTLSLVFRKKDIKNLPEWLISSPVVDIPLVFYLMTQGKVHFFKDSMGVYRKDLPGSWSKKQSKISFYKKMKSKIMYNYFLHKFNKFTSNKYNREIFIHSNTSKIKYYMMKFILLFVR